MSTQTKKCPTIAEIAAKNAEAGLHYFNRETLRFFGQTLGDFRARRIAGRVIVYAFTHKGWNIGFAGRPSSLAEFNEATGETSTPVDAEQLKELLKR